MSSNFSYESGSLRDNISDIDKLENALSLYNQMVPMRPLPRVIQFNKLLARIIKMKHYHSAISVFRDMRGNKGIILVDDYTLGMGIDCYCLVGRVDFGFSLFGALLKLGFLPNATTFGTLLKGEGSLQDAGDVFEIMIQRGENSDTVIYNVLMNGYCLQGQMDKARKIFDTVVNRGVHPDILSHSTLMNGHFKKNENDKAMHLLREIPQRGLRADVGTYNIVLQGLFRMARYRSAREVFVEMQAVSLTPDFHTYCTMLDGLCKCGHIEEALQFLQKMQFDGVKLDITMYNIILHGLCKSGRFQCAGDLFNNLSLKGMEHNVSTYKTMITNLCLKGLLDEAKEFFVKIYESGSLRDNISDIDKLENALSLYNQMVPMRPLPRVIQFNKLLARIIKMKHYHSAISVFRDMRGNKGIILVDDYTLGMGIDCYCLVGRVDFGFSLFGALLKLGFLPNATTFGTLLKGEGSLQDAGDVFEIMIQRGENSDTVIYNVLMNGYCLQGQMDKARKIFDTVVNRGVHPDILSHSTLMNGHFKKNENDKAMHLLREIPQRGLRADVGTYNIVLQGLFRMARYRSAREVFVEMQAVSLTPDFHTYCTMLDGLCKCGHIEEALQFLQKMQFDGVKLDITMYNIILHGLCKSGRFQCAGDLFNNLSLKGMEHNVSTYKTMITNLCLKGLLDEAKEFFVKIYESGSLRDNISDIDKLENALSLYNQMVPMRPLPRVIQFNKLLARIIKMKHYHSAISVFRDMRGNKGIILVDDYTLGMGIDCYCLVGRVDFGFSLFGALLKLGFLPNATTFGTLLKGEGSLQDAGDVFEIMIQRGENSDTVIYNVLMNGYCLQGQMDKARKIFDTVVNRGVHPDILSHSTLMNGHFKKNENDKAMHLLREIPQRGLRADVGTYNIVLQGLFRMARYRSAREVFVEMQAVSLTPDFHTYCTMLDGLCKCGHIEEALQFLQKMQFDGVKLDITMYNIILHGLCKSGRFQCAGDLFNNLSLKGMEHNVSTYKTMITNLCLKGLLDEAKEFFVKIYESGSLRDNISDIDKLENALSLYNQMVPMRPLPRVIQFNKLLARIIKMKHYHSAISVFRDMRGNKGIILVDDYTLGMGIDCYCLVGRVDFGFSLFGALLKLGFLPNATTFGTLLKGFFRQNM
ncbi:protein Rf1, mitochondrial-like, partial [Coffea eugenioides]|uniref:protein Rf1, mitochondrial-like n=2 Tax=Coffea eugenioides TaxID=49369 RepID=UPI000F605747